MDTTSNPSPTHRSPRSGAAAAAAAFESSELVSIGAGTGIGSPKHRSRGGVGGTSSVSPAAVTQVIRIGDLESIVSSTGIVVAPAPAGPMEVGTSSVTHDRSPRRSVAAAAAATASLLDDGSAEAQQESSEHGSGGGNAVKKPAWNKLSNVANAEVVAASVMGAESWPALSESTRASPKSLSSESLKASSDGLLSAAQGTGTAVLSSPKQEKNSHAIPNLTPNHAPFNRQRSMKRGGGNSSNSVVANGGSSQLPSRSSGMDAAPNNSGRQGNYANDSSSKDSLHQDSGQKGGFGSHSDGGNGHQPQRNSSFRRGNGGPHSRGDGGYHNNGFGGRRSDQERGSHDWNSNRSFPVRDNHIQPQRGPLRPSIRGPPTPPFILPPQVAVHPYGGMPVMYPDMQPVMYFQGPHPDPYRPVALGPPMAPMIYAFPPSLELHTNILSQIEYYFSNENLIKDMFLRQRMDDQGWVHINLIANFKKVKQLTDNIPLILDVLRSSSILEVEGEKIRRREDWNKWLMPQPIPQYSAGSSGTHATEDTLSANLQNTTLDDKAPPPRHGGGMVAEMYHQLSSSSSGEWSNSYTKQSSQVPVPVQGGADTSAALDSR